MNGRFDPATRNGMLGSRRARGRWMLVAAPAALMGSWLLSDMFDSDRGAASAATARSTNIMVTAFVPLVCTASSGSSTAANPIVSGPDSTNVSVSVATPASICSDGSKASVSVEDSSGVISAADLVNTTGGSSYVERDGTRVVVAELALDGRLSPLRLVTVTY